MKECYSPIEGILVVEHLVHRDPRGFFKECFRYDWLNEYGYEPNFIQQNLSRSNRKVLRGLHFTKIKPQSQLVTVMRGAIFDVVVDVRPHSETFGKWFGVELNENKVQQIFMEAGFAHGFCVLSDMADVHYSVDQKYDPNDNFGILWNDNDLNIAWPIKKPLISVRDEQFSTWKEVRASLIGDE